MDKPVQHTRDTSKKRKIILDGAIEVFSQVGYEVASMDRIAEVAGVSKRTVYNHFGNKEKLFEAIVDILLQGRESRKVIPYDAGKSLKEQLLLFAEAELYLIGDEERRKMSRILTLAFLKDIEFAFRSRMKYDHPHKHFLEWLDLALKDNRLVVENPSMAARVFYGLVEGGITWPALFASQLNREYVDPYLEEAVDIFLLKYGAKGD